MEVDSIIRITYNNGSAPTIENSEGKKVENASGDTVKVIANSDTVTIVINGEDVVVDAPKAKTQYNFIVSGTTTNGSLKIDGSHRIGLYLNKVNITNPRGPAINIQNGKRISVYLAGENSLSDGLGWTPDSSKKATFFSEGSLVFQGGGLLEVKGKSSHAIVSDGYFKIQNGCITIPEAERDGIHANDTIIVEGGTINIISKGDAIQSERLNVKVSGGRIAANTKGVKSHGIASAGSTSISMNAEIKLNVSGDGSKGIRSKNDMKIEGGTIDIHTSGGRHIDDSKEDTTSNAAGIKADGNLSIEGGSLTIKSTGDKSKGINIDGNMSMIGGHINIEANDDGIKVTGTLTVTGGSGTVASRRKSAIDCSGANIENIKKFLTLREGS